MRTVIGIDNGVSGSIGILTADGALMEATPTREALHYGKKGTIYHRLDRHAFRNILAPHAQPGALVIMERPFTGKNVNAMLVAHRLFEAQLCVLEDLNMGLEVVDSGPWQEAILGLTRGVGSAALKKASRLRGIQLYPTLAATINSHKDADGLLIARYYANSYQQ